MACARAAIWGSLRDNLALMSVGQSASDACRFALFREGVCQGGDAPEQLSDEDWDLLLSRIYQRECVPFLGAAVNIKGGNYAGLPLGSDVALSLLARDLKISDADLSAKTFVDVLPRHPAFEKSGKFEDLARCVLSDLGRVALYYRGHRDIKFLGSFPFIWVGNY